jgi:hypothetical protein
VTKADLRLAAPRIDHHGPLMDWMLLASDLDPVAVQQAFSGVIVDFEVTQARRRESGICRRNLRPERPRKPTVRSVAMPQ